MKTTEPKAMAMIHKIREDIFKDTHKMSADKMMEYFKKNSKTFNKNLTFITHQNLKKAA